MAGIVSVEAYKEVLLVLGTAGVIVPLLQRFKVSPVLGFLGMGILIGPHGLGALARLWPWLDAVTITQSESIATAADLGIVFLMFMMGLELSVERLRTMRKFVFGLGTLQVVLSAIAITAILRVLGGPKAGSIIIGASLALSSTAIVLQLLSERKRLSSVTGRVCFAVLLFQDLAVAPILFMVDVLSKTANGALTESLALAISQAVLALGLVVLLGRRLLRPTFRLAAGAAAGPETFMAASLFIIMATALGFAAAGLSMALGAFIAGLLLAGTEYRREIEVIIEPFKGILLGVFFFFVGAGVDLGQLARTPVLVLCLVAGLIGVKTLMTAPLAILFRIPPVAALKSALLLAPAGEFAFVVTGAGVANGLVPAEFGHIVLVAASLSMVTIPLMERLGSWLGARFGPSVPIAPPSELALPPEGSESKVIIVGFGRVGQLVGEMLASQSISYIAVDSDAALVSRQSANHAPVYYGNAQRGEFLERCGLQKASALVVTMDHVASVNVVVETARALRNDLLIVARARDARHAGHLYAIGANDAVPEAIEASLQLSESALIGAGVPMGTVIAAIHERRDLFRKQLQYLEEKNAPASSTVPVITKA